MSLKHTHLIWDFNGTILQDVDLTLRCTNTMLAARDLPTFSSVEAYREVFGFPIDEYYRRMGFDFEKEDYETVLAPEWASVRDVPTATRRVAPSCWARSQNPRP